MFWTYTDRQITKNKNKKYRLVLWMDKLCNLYKYFLNSISPLYDTAKLAPLTQSEGQHFLSFAWFEKLYYNIGKGKFLLNDARQCKLELGHKMLNLIHC